MNSKVAIVDKHDIMQGTMDKLAAHRTGKLHRALSVFIFNSKGELLLQQRALHKYHSGGLWSNTCCSHPNPGESVKNAAKRRLFEEMGFDCDLDYQFNFIYREIMSNGLVEHEFDHVFFGFSDLQPILNASEVADYRYISIEQLAQELANNPHDFSRWLNICFNRIENSYQNYAGI